MFRKKPFLVWLVSIYLFFVVAAGFILTLFPIFFYIYKKNYTELSTQDIYLGIAMNFALTSLYLITGIGVINKKKWGRLFSILLFIHEIYFEISDLLESDSVSYEKLVFLLIFLYAMTLNKSVKNYFNRS